MNPINPEFDKAMAIAASLRDAWGLRCVDDVALLAVWLIDQLHSLAERTDADREFAITLDDYCRDCPPIERRAMAAEGRCRRADVHILSTERLLRGGRWTVYGLIRDNPGATVRQIATTLGVSRDTAKSLLRRLRKSGLVRSGNERYSKTWYAKDT